MNTKQSLETQVACLQTRLADALCALAAARKEIKLLQEPKIKKGHLAHVGQDTWYYCVECSTWSEGSEISRCWPDSTQSVLCEDCCRRVLAAMEPEERAKLDLPADRLRLFEPEGGGR
jgi:hypothetical protein